MKNSGFHQRIFDLRSESEKLNKNLQKENTIASKGYFQFMYKTDPLLIRKVSPRCESNYFFHVPMGC